MPNPTPSRKRGKKKPRVNMGTWHMVFVRTKKDGTVHHIELVPTTNRTKK